MASGLTAYTLLSMTAVPYNFMIFGWLRCDHALVYFLKLSCAEVHVDEFTRRG